MDGQSPTPDATGNPGSSPPFTQSSAFDRINGESDKAFRAFLLWAMQASDRRSVRAVGRAVGRAESTVREWRNRWRWNDRAKACAPLTDTKASAVYRAQYFEEYRLREIVEISDRMAAPFRPDMPIPSSVAESIRDATQPTGSSDDERKREKRTRRAHMSLVDGALGLIAKRIAAGDVRVSLRDIPLLMQLRHELGGNSGGDGKSVLAPVESTRVRHAKASGGDIVRAMHEDAEELVAILGAVVAAGDVAPGAASEAGQEPGEEGSARSGDDEAEIR